MGELLDKRLKAVSSEAAFISDAIRYRYLRSAEGSIFMTFIAPHVGRGKHFDKALDKHMQRKPAPPLPDNAVAEPREASASGNLLYDTRKNT